MCLRQTNEQIPSYIRSIKLISTNLATLPEVLGPLVDLAAVRALAEHLRGVLSPPVFDQGLLAVELREQRRRLVQASFSNFPFIWGCTQYSL